MSAPLPKLLPPFDEATRQRLADAPRRLVADGGPMRVKVFVDEQDLQSALAEIDRLRRGIVHQNNAIEQTLGRALGYPWYKDDPENFPDATEDDGVCVGDHVAETLAMEAAAKIDRLTKTLHLAP